MATYADREAFIPYRRTDLIDLCVEDGKLQGAEVKKFREFCEIVSAYYHFDFHQVLEGIKNNFAHLDPDTDTKPKNVPTAQECKTREEELVKQFQSVLERANYKRLTEEEWKIAKEQDSLIKLNMDVDFDDFEIWRCYHRGDGKTTTQIKKLFKKIDFTMDTYERVVLLLKFRDEAYFKSKGRKLDTLNFTPGKMYVYFYKKIPKADMEILFPNVSISMKLKDRLLLFVPAAGAGLLTLLKVLGSLLLLAGILFLMCGFPGLAELFDKNIAKRDPHDLKTIIAALTGLGILGGFVFKQYVSYKNKRLKFLKDVTDTLFFRNLDCNGGVFKSIVDSAEEEECKEVVLAYYHLMTNKSPLNEEQLDNTIEEWLEKKFNTKIDFAVSKAIGKLEAMKGKLKEDGPDVAVLSRDSNGICKVLALDEAKTVVDYVWDNFFQYND